MPIPVENLTGKEFGLLTAKYVMPKEENGPRKHTWWMCECKCGTSKPIRADVLKIGHATSCGCTSHLKKDGTPKRWNGCGELPANHWSRIKDGATRRGLEFSITMEFAWNLFQNQEAKCALTGLPIQFGGKRRETTASLDRRDSSLGYTPDNVQWVHKKVNKFKNALSEAEFFQLCELVVDTHRKKAIAA